jgi:hypothetical protein
MQPVVPTLGARRMAGGGWGSRLPAVGRRGASIVLPKRRRTLRRPNGRGGFRTCDLSRVKRALSH